MNNICGCEVGEKCTKTTVCAIEMAVEDALWEANTRIEELEAKLAAQAEYIMISNRVNNNLKKQLREDE